MPPSRTHSSPAYPAGDDELVRSPIEERTSFELLSLPAQRANGEILIGCLWTTAEEVDLFPTLDGLNALTEDILDDFPGLRKAGIDRVWAGVLPFTSDLVPIVDEIYPGLIIGPAMSSGTPPGR